MEQELDDHDDDLSGRPGADAAEEPAPATLDPGPGEAPGASPTGAGKSAGAGADEHSGDGDGPDSEGPDGPDPEGPDGPDPDGPDREGLVVESPVVVRRSATTLLTWGTVALVLVIVVVLVAVKLSGTSTTSTPSAAPANQPAPASIVQALTKIPASVFNAVGVTSPDAAVSAPTILRGQPALDYDGKPGVLYVGGEFCPYCAAQRWAIVAALSRFGSVTGLDTMESGSNEVFAATPTFTFLDTHFSSRYVNAVLVEHYGVQKNGAGTGYAVLQPLTGDEQALLSKYGDPTSAGTGPLLPFLDVGNRAVVDGGSFSPSILQQLSASQIAGGLSDPKDPATQAIVAAANYVSASICSVDGEQPASVCASKGVVAADVALGLTS